MASSRNRPGPHDRKVDPETGLPRPKPKCVQLTRLGKRCKRDEVGKGVHLCKTHDSLAKANMAASQHSTPEDAPTRTRQRDRRRQQVADQGGDPDLDSGPSPEPSDLVVAGVTSAAKRKAATTFVINQQARDALRRLGKNPDPALDPKRVLLDNVESAWRQRQVWEQMLMAIPEEDWSSLGQTPIPGVPGTSKGARIEVIQKFLLEATKVSTRTSKLALDAGIEDRLVRLAEEQSALIADTVRSGILAGIAALFRLGIISEADQAAANEAAIGSAANHLRQLASGEGQNEQGVTRRAEPEIYEGIAEDMTPVKRAKQAS